MFVRDYIARHSNPWNRALHVVGVPLAPVLFLILLALGRFREAAAAFVAGYFLQWLGHRIQGDGMWDTLEGKLVKKLLPPFRRSPMSRPAERATVSLVTGGSGFVGNRLARALVERGDRVRALVRDPAGSADLSAIGVELVQGDMTDEESLRRAVEGVDRVFHTAGLVGDWLDRRQAVEVNVEGTRRLLAAAVAAGVTRVVHVSSLSVLGTKHHHGTDESGAYVYGDPYTDTKIDSEQVALEFGAGGGIEVAVIRPGFVYGPGDNHILLPLVQRLRSGRFAFIGDGGKEMNTVYIDDVVRVALLADTTPGAAGQAYNITDGRNTTIREFVTFVAEYLDVPVPTKHVPAPIARVAAAVMESVARAVGAKSPPPLNRSRLRFLYYNQRYSIEKARRVLGYEPQVGYREGLPPALDWIQAVERTKRAGPR
ncbi:MAG TPA: NAD-dependent epimerase/dehydratase family protein [Gaiellaceae bacterium]|nr:NAD-dependent epimerase/dehydratase family protein [Gaiellaceae bacterium]